MPKSTAELFEELEQKFTAKPKGVDPYYRAYLYAWYNLIFLQAKRLFFLGYLLIFSGIIIIGATIAFVYLSYWLDEETDKIPQSNTTTTITESNTTTTITESNTTTTITESNTTTITSEGNKFFLSERVVLSIIGIITGVLTDFIGALFLRMHSTTMDSYNAFHERLWKSHNIELGRLDAITIKDRAMQRSTRSEIAKSLVAGSTGGTGGSAGTTKITSTKKTR
jgi:hypothetical protein